jgi:hypothetical protein
MCFFTDNSELARAGAAPGVQDNAMLWKIRRHAIQFQNLVVSFAALGLSHLEGNQWSRP